MTEPGEELNAGNPVNGQSSTMGILNGVQPPQPTGNVQVLNSVCTKHCNCLRPSSSLHTFINTSQIFPEHFLVIFLPFLNVFFSFQAELHLCCTVLHLHIFCISLDDVVHDVSFPSEHSLTNFFPP